MSADNNKRDPTANGVNFSAKEMGNDDQKEPGRKNENSTTFQKGSEAKGEPKSYSQGGGRKRGGLEEDEGEGITSLPLPLSKNTRDARACDMTQERVKNHSSASEQTRESRRSSNDPVLKSAAREAQSTVGTASVEAVADSGITRVNVPSPIAPYSNVRVGAVAVPGAANSVVRDDVESNHGTVASSNESEMHVVEAITREDMAQELREQMRSEMRQELQADMVMAQVIEETPRRFWNKRRLIAAVVLVCLVVVGVVVGSVLAIRGDEPHIPPNPKGFTVRGINNDDRFGESIALSGDASTLASVAKDGNYAQVFRRTANNTWTESGEPLIADFDVEDEFEAVVDLNYDGSLLLVARKNDDEAAKDAGSAKVYRLNGTSLEQVGQTLLGVASEDLLGSSASISDDGLTIALGAELGDSLSLVDAGYVRVFAFDGDRWQQLGSALTGSIRSEQLGRSVALSADGQRIAIGALGGIPEKKGIVRVFEYNGTDWDPLGQSFEGTNVEDEADVVDISSDGTTLAIASDGADTSAGTNGGLVRVYKLDGCCTWSQQGRDILGEAGAKGGFGSSFLALSADGSCIVIGSRHEDNEAGRGYLYEWRDSQWEHIVTIRGEKRGDNLGKSLAMSENCSAIAFGAPQRYTSGNAPGYISIYNKENLD